jgi:23S rRNA (cytidine1920-2'-O)/16S rRNA (cytidine1409-2'-O)-methyltransferase
VSGGTRADRFLVDHGYAKSRAEAQGAIRAGKVSVDGVVLRRPAQRLRDGALVGYTPAHPYVSRGALKLIAALDHFGFSPAQLSCLDIGASTGGFTQVLLERGAKQVTAIDVGHGQMDPALAADPRVEVFEGVNARALEASYVGRPRAIVVDVSFISLTLVLPPALTLAGDTAWLVALVKPQFEVGREHIGRGGLVRDTAEGLAAAERIALFVAQQPRWQIRGLIESPIAGGDGNREYLLGAQKNDGTAG